MNVIVKNVLNLICIYLFYPIRFKKHSASDRKSTLLQILGKD